MFGSCFFTRRFNWAVSALDVALQLEGSHVLPVAVVAGRVAFPALTVLLLQLQVVLHVVHEPAQEDGHTLSFTSIILVYVLFCIMHIFCYCDIYFERFQ